jgi:hypothetical protein
MQVAPSRRPPLAPAHTHTHAHAGTHSAHAYEYTRMHCYARTHMRTHTCTQSCTSSARARKPARPRVGAIGGAGVSAAAAALTESSASASRPPPAAPRAGSYTRACAPTVRPCRAAPAHRDRAPVGRARQPRARARRGRRPTTGNAAAAASNAARGGPRFSARCGSATRQQRSAGTAANAHGRRRRRAHSSSKRLHWPSDSGSAFTFVPSMYLPHTARACGPRPPRNQWADVGSNGLKPQESRDACPKHAPACA